MKHLFAILLASAMVFAFAACSSSNDAPASQGTTEQEVATDEEKEEPSADATEEKPVEPEQPTGAEDEQQTITGTIVESAENLSCVSDCFLLAHLGALAVKEGYVSTFVKCRNFERTSCSCGSFFE